jgi:hypothetical protein
LPPSLVHPHRDELAINDKQILFLLFENMPTILLFLLSKNMPTILLCLLSENMPTISPFGIDGNPLKKHATITIPL